LPNRRDDERDDIIVVGRFTLDLRRARLQVDGKHVVLRPQSFEVLRVLAQNRGQLVSKQTLLDEVWGDAVVTDDSLTQCLGDIRRALGDSEKIIVRTVPRKGYVFEGDLVVPGSETEPEGGRRKLWLAGAAAALLVGVFLWETNDLPVEDSAGRPQSTIAILPFVDMTAGQDMRFLGEGLAEEVLNLLDNSSELRVLARRTSFSVADTGQDIAAIGERLGVTHVVEGSVRQGGDRLRISAQLIDTAESKPLWSQSYDRPLVDILDIQTDIAESIASALRAALEPTTVANDVGDPRAHALVIQARSMLRLSDSAGIASAQSLLERALTIDPASVEARLQLARAHFYQRGDPHSPGFLAAWSRFSELTDEAYRLNPDHPIANAWKGWEALHYYQDWENAARYYERAMALDPTDLDTAGAVINALIILDNLESAVMLGQYVVERDPLCLSCYNSLSLAASKTGNHELAEQARLRAMEFSPDNRFNWSNIANTRLRRGDDHGALDALDKVDMSRVSTMTAAYAMNSRAIASFRLGRLDEYAEWRQQLVDEYGDRYPTAVAQVEAVAGNLDAAFEWLDRHLVQPTWMRGVNYRSDFFENLHADPRWERYLERLGLSERQRRQIDFNPTLPL
jgi:TolB-like protein/DNA-binding winged helix-turn-helix (wHTH) protein/Tfp pilus assembly protein PilF